MPDEEADGALSGKMMDLTGETDIVGVALAGSGKGARRAGYGFGVFKAAFFFIQGECHEADSQDKRCAEHLPRGAVSGSCGWDVHVTFTELVTNQPSAALPP